MNERFSVHAMWAAVAMFIVFVTATTVVIVTGHTEEAATVAGGILMFVMMFVMVFVMWRVI